MWFRLTSGSSLHDDRSTAAALAKRRSCRVPPHIILGILQTLGVVFLEAGYKNLVAFIVLLILLFLRPQGLFGSLVEQK